MTIRTYSMIDVLRVEESEKRPRGPGCRACVTGGRDFEDLGFVWSLLDSYRFFHDITEFGFGCATGVDRLAWNWCKLWDMPWRRYVADWDGLDKAAGIKRNGAMLRDFQPDILLVFPGGTGTTNCAKQARGLGIQREFLEVDNDPLSAADKWG